MLVIRKQQMQVFETAAWQSFEKEMILHSQGFSPRLCAILGDEQVRVVIRSAINRAMSYDFTNRGPIRLFIEMSFLCGSAFDTDPQYAAIHEVLCGPGDQMYRAQRIHEGHLGYLERVSGPGAANVRNALRDLLDFARAPLPFSAVDLEPGLLSAMTKMFPQKVAWVGESRLRTLIQEARAEARKYGFSSARQETLITVLMFAFGHGCTDDPLYPWISRTLQDERITDPSARAGRLERKAVTWLEHVLANPPASEP